jgi:hypothetical protein
MVKFGQAIIVKESIQNIMDDIKKNEWTDNKIYKSASDIDIVPIFDTKSKNFENYNQQSENFKNLVNKIKSNREILEKIGNVYFSKEIKTEDSNNFKHFEKIIMDNYYDDRILSKKRNTATLINSLSNLRHIKQNDKNILKQVDISEISKFKNSKFLEFISAYKIDLLCNIEYNKLNYKEKENFRSFLDNQEKRKYGITDINSFNNNQNKTEFRENQYNRIFDYNINDKKQDKFSKIDESEALIQRLILFNDFRTYVKYQGLTDNQIANYFRNTNDMRQAAELYFNDVYGSKKLKISFVFPNGREYSHELELVASPDELFTFVFSIHPNYSTPKLIKPDGTQIEINPITDKFIGGLKLPHNVKLAVKPF